MAKALVFGATGFVGASLLEILLRETKYTEVLAVTRKPLSIAVGADEKSSVFYVRTKGETDRDIKNLGYARTNIFRPSIIMGERPEKRLLESAAISLFSVVNSAMIGKLSRYRGIDARTIANAMVLAPKSGGERTVVYQWRDMMDLNSKKD